MEDKLLNAKFYDQLNVVAEAAYQHAKSMHRTDLIRDISDLWQVFTFERAGELQDYFRKPKFRRAYQGFYLPLYAAKLALIMRKLMAEGLLPEPANGLRLLDLGAGPLSATLAAHLAFGRVEECLAVDKSEAPMRMGLEVLEQLFSKSVGKVRLKQANMFGPPIHWRPNFRPNLIVIAHVLNEFGTTERDIIRNGSLVEKLVDSLEPSGRCLIVDPATRGASLALMKLRDELVDSGQVHVLAPCTGATECPLLKMRGSWCHAELNWERPKCIRHVDEALGLDHRKLQFSYLLLAKKAAPAGVDEKLRIVSGLMRADGVSRRYACTRDGLLTLVQKDHIGKDLVSLSRGEMIDKAWLSEKTIQVVKERHER